MSSITNKTRQYLIFYTLCIFIAMPFYQGGHLLDSTTNGYNFFRNFVSDLAEQLVFHEREILHHLLFFLQVL